MPCDSHTLRQPEATPSDQRQRKGRQNYLAGQSGEQTVARHYRDLGYKLLAQRWRAAGGELDLVFEGAEGLVFVEVKTARSHERAAERLSRQQMNRIFAGAAVFADHYAGGALVDMRFDVALVDGLGMVQVLENAFMAE